MKTMIYKSFNAQDVANRIIAREEEYLNTDYSSLCFEDKCHYALEYTPIVHVGIAPDPKHRAALLNDLRPELLRRAQAEDGFALYVLGSVNADCSAPATDTELCFLKRSLKAGYLPAAIDLVSRFYNRHDPKARKEALQEYLIPTINKLDPQSEQDLSLTCGIMMLLSEYESIGDARKFFYRRALDYTERRVLNGSYPGLAKLCVTGSACKGGIELVDSPVTSFWQTVDFLVLSHFYRRGARHLADMLGMKLLNERGCDNDVEAFKEIYIDLMLHRSYDRVKLLEALSVSHGEDFEDLCEAERICRRQISDGHPDRYWRLVLLALLSRDPKRLRATCDEVCAVRNGLHACNVSKAYHMLRRIA